MNLKNSSDLTVLRTRSVGTYDASSVIGSPKEKQAQANAFVRKLKKDKLDRERQHKMISEARDAAFLTKL